MSEFNWEANQPRRIVPGPLLSHAGFRIKTYAFAFGLSGARSELVEAAEEWARTLLATSPTKRRHHGVGFLGINDGNGSCQVFLDLWVEQNELHHYIQVAPKEDPSALKDAPDDYNSVCVWDLAVQCHERDAWVRHVLRNSDGPDIDGYLSDSLNAEV
jgi:hypothetical protein